MFGIDLPRITLSRDKEKFIQRLNRCDNTLIKRVIVTAIVLFVSVHSVLLCVCATY